IRASGERLLECAADCEWVLLGDHALSGSAGVDGNAGQLDEFLHLRPGLRPEETIATGDQWPLRRMKHLDRTIDLGRVALRTEIIDRESARAFALPGVILVVVQDVLRNLEQGHALRRRDRFAKRGAKIEFDAAPIGHTLGELGEALYDFGSVGFLERTEMVLGVRMLARDANDRGAGEPCDAESGDRIGQAASRRDHADARLSADARVS